ncbi:MAG: ImmA/IrrE family metallo-endopeptidase [Methylomonas sp.]|jgi:Zn-dependent peptidase ImmA (M78 family)
MTAKSSILNAAHRANEVNIQFKIKDRIDSGYTRIDPSRIAEETGITVMFQPLDKLLGAFLREENRLGILINLARPAGLIHMTCAHELGHFFLNHPTTADTKIADVHQSELIERQADQFAYSLLAPNWLITLIARIKNWGRIELQKPEIIYQLSLRLGISFSATIFSLVRHNHISNAIGNNISGIAPAKLKKQLLGNFKIKNPNSDVWLLDKADSQLIIEPRVDDVFVLELQSHFSSGYIWELDEVIKEGYRLEPILLNAEEITPSASLIKTVAVGQSSKHRCIVFPNYFDEEQTIESTNSISLTESQPWTNTNLDNPTYSFSPEYEILRVGLSSIAKKRIVTESRVNL